MRKIAALLLMMLLGSGGMFAAYQAAAQDEATRASAVELAASHPDFAAGLENVGDWTAQVYNTRNAYGIWHVEFYNSAGDQLGWADVNPERERVYSWEAYFGVDDATREEAYPTLREFIDNAPEVLELVDDPSVYEIYVDFDGYSDYWGVYLDRGPDSLYIVVRFSENTLTMQGEPELVRLYFSEVQSYEDWYQTTSAEAVAVAFAAPEVADAVRGVEGWTTQTESEDGVLWTVTFLNGEEILAKVVVNLEDRSVEAAE